MIAYLIYRLRARTNFGTRPQKLLDNRFEHIAKPVVLIKRTYASTAWGWLDLQGERFYVVTISIVPAQIAYSCSGYCVPIRIDAKENIMSTTSRHFRRSSMVLQTCNRNAKSSFITYLAEDDPCDQVSTHRQLAWSHKWKEHSRCLVQHCVTCWEHADISVAFHQHDSDDF